MWGWCVHLSTEVLATQPQILNQDCCLYVAIGNVRLASNWCVSVHLSTEPPWGGSGIGHGAGRAGGRRRKMAIAGFVINIILL